MTFSELLPAHITPFADVPSWAIACVIASYFFGFFVRGAFGFGSNMPIVLLTTWLLGPHHAILLTALAAAAAQIHLLPQGIATADWRVSRQLIAGMVRKAAIILVRCLTSLTSTSTSKSKNS